MRSPIYELENLLSGNIRHLIAHGTNGKVFTFEYELVATKFAIKIFQKSSKI